MAVNVIQAKECVFSLQLNMNTSEPLKPYAITDVWITEFTQLLYINLQKFSTEHMERQGKLHSYFDLYRNMKVYVPPVLPIMPQMLFFQNDMSNSTCEILQAMKNRFKETMKDTGVTFKIRSDNAMTSLSVRVYTTVGVATTVSAGIISLIILLILAALVVGVVMYRRYGDRLHCSPVYFRMPTLARNGTTRSHIVRTRTDDRDPIVDDDDEDEFIDEELDAMETIGNTENGMGTLEFQSA